MKFLCLLSLLILFTACGGGGAGGGSTSSGGTSDTTNGVSNVLDSSIGSISGVLLDSAIQGIDYESTSHSGTTNASGEYTCQAGETVTFKIGNYEIGSVTCLEVTTPIEIATNGSQRWNDVSFSNDQFSELSSSQNQKVQRMVMLVQSLDEDGDPNNGITISSSTKTTINSLVTSQSEFNNLLTNDDSTFESSVNNIVSNLSGSQVSVTNKTTALSHFKNTLDNTTNCSTSDITGSTKVRGITTNCVALSCSASYSLSNGRCVAKTACTTSDVINSTSVSGFVEDGCKATACATGYSVNNNQCDAMTACTTSNVNNSSSVSGFVDNNTCKATACQNGYKVENDACVESSASQVVSDAIDALETANSTTFVNLYINGVSSATVCSNENGDPLSVFSNSINKSSIWSSLESSYNNRGSNNFLTDNVKLSSGYPEARECLGYIIYSLVQRITSSRGLNREQDLLDATGASSASDFNNDGNLNQYEEEVLKLIFQKIE